MHIMDFLYALMRRPRRVNASAKIRGRASFRAKPTNNIKSASALRGRASLTASASCIIASRHVIAAKSFVTARPVYHLLAFCNFRSKATVTNYDARCWSDEFTDEFG